MPPAQATEALVSAAQRARVGIDIGGTFTDVVYQSGDQPIRYEKVLTTPDDITNGILVGLETADADIAGLDLFLHGTTVALNAFLQGKTPPVGLVTSAGFRDVLEIMRTNRPDMYDLQQEKPPPLVPRRYRREVTARLSATGDELEPVDEAEVRAIARDFAADGIKSVAVCLLHSYADARHERRIREILLDERLELWVSISSDLSQEWREFERTSTTVINAAAAPIVDAYLRRLEVRLREHRFGADLLIMQSNGGVMTADEARRRPVATLMSGPVGGVAGAEAIARELDGAAANLVTLDIGGTSADVAIVDAGESIKAAVTNLERWPILMPMVDIRSIGAGGGSIAFVDDHGGLKVGPESAGAVPGPACYGLGGERATVTDANLVLGRISPSKFLFPLDGSKARAALSADVAQPYGMTVEEAAEGILTVVNSNMSRLLRDVLIQRGFDPRRFTLVAFGGGGALHACAVADEAGLTRVLVPPHPGTLSAYGIFCADVRYDQVAMFINNADRVEDASLEEAYLRLEAETSARIRGGGDSLSPQIRRFAELRYVGQEYTLTVDAARAGAGVRHCVARFHGEHARLYGFSREGVGVEFVKLAVAVLVPTRQRTHVERRYTSGGGVTARPVWEGKTLGEVPVHDRGAVATGAVLHGPCVVEEPGATTYVGARWSGSVDANLNIVLERR